MNRDGERYAYSVTHTLTNQVCHQYCGRRRCTILVYLQRHDDEVPDRQWRYDGKVIVVSLDDGTIKKAFCSRKCAAAWLVSMEIR